MAILQYYHIVYGGCAHISMGQSMVGASIGNHQGCLSGPLLFVLSINPLICSVLIPLHRLEVRRWDNVGENSGGLAAFALVTLQAVTNECSEDRHESH